MCRLRILLLILNIFILRATASICDFNDDKCVTRAADKLLKLMSGGIPGLLAPLDPLHEARIVLTSPDIKCLLTNVTLAGMKHCRVDLLSFKPKELKYVYALRCPHFVLTSDYSIKGTLGSVHLDHEGSLQVTIHDYVVTFKGKNGQAFGKEDNKLRLYIEAYHIDRASKGGMKIEDTGVKKGDRNLVQLAWQYLNENWQNVSKLLTNPTMHKFMSKYMESLNVYLKKIPVDDIFNVREN